MKTKILFLTLLAMAINTFAADSGTIGFATGGVVYSAKTNYAIIGNRSKTSSSQPIVTFLNATSDATAATTGIVQFYRTTNFWSAASGYTNSTTNLYLQVNTGTGEGSTNGITSSSLCVIEHNSMNPTTWEMVVLNSVLTNAATNIVVSPSGTTTNYVVTVGAAATPTNSVVPGDNIYLCVTNGAGYVPVGVGNTNYASSGGIWTGQRDKPLLLLTVGGTNATINAVNAIFTQ